MGNPVKRRVVWLTLSVLLAVPARLSLTLWHVSGALTGAALAGRTAIAEAQCHGCDCCAPDQQCAACPSTFVPVACCAMGARCVKDFFSLSVHCEPACPPRNECTGPCSDGQGDCFISCCGANHICDASKVCISDPCPEASRCGTDCCVDGATCVNDQCVGGCANPCGDGETCENGQCVPGSSSTPTPNGGATATPSATGIATPSPTPSPVRSRCDAGKLGCVAKRQACLLTVHAAAEKKGEAPDAGALQKCVDAFGSCVAKLEEKQNPEKPKTLCSVTGDLAALASAGDDFVSNIVTTIDPTFPTVGPASLCDGGKKTCVAQRTACLLKLHAAAVKNDALVDPAAVAKCTDKFDGGAKGFAKGCLGKLQDKQDAAKPKTLCAVTDDGTALETRVDAFVDATVGAILDPD